jgi:hypothetical protein
MSEKVFKNYSQNNFNALKKSVLLVLPVLKSKLDFINQFHEIICSNTVQRRSSVKQKKQLMKLIASLENVLEYEYHARTLFKITKQSKREKQTP